MDKTSTAMISEIFPWQPDQISGAKPARLKNFVNGKWVEAKKYREVVDPVSGEPFIQMPDTSEEELAPFIESLAKCPKYGLHNPLRNVERYLVYGRVSKKLGDFLTSSDGKNSSPG